MMAQTHDASGRAAAANGHNKASHDGLLYAPNARHVLKTALWAFLRHVETTYKQNLSQGRSDAWYTEVSADDARKALKDAYTALHKWSVTHATDFWWSMLQQSGCPIERDAALEPAGHPVAFLNQNSLFPRQQYFPSVKLNFTEALLTSGSIDAIAIRQRGESLHQDVTYGQLRGDVLLTMRAMQTAGVQEGYVLGGYMPNCVEGIVAMLAAAALGAMWTSASPDFGVEGVVSKFGQVGVRMLFSVRAVKYNGKVRDHVAKLGKVYDALKDTVEKVVIVETFCTENKQAQSPMPTQLASKVVSWTAFLGPQFGDAAYYAGAPFAPHGGFQRFAFDTPLFVMYSSGTTGKPKCIVHGAGGSLVNFYKEHALHGNMKAHDRLFFYTTTGWMMWQWLVGGLITGGSILVYDGSPMKPSVDVMWKTVEQDKITILGTSPKFLTVIEDMGQVPRETADLSTLRSVLSTGAPCTDANFRFVYEKIKKDLVLGSISGGTDILGCFMGVNPLLAVYSGEIQAPMLGMDVHAIDDAGKSIEGERGDLVCKTPFISQPVKFMNDADGALYKKAYFGGSTTTWAHGDFLKISTTTGGFIMLGRSDGTLNQAGIRFGSSELYDVLAGVEEVEDALAVGHMWNSDERVVLFLKMAPMAREGETVHTLTPTLLNKIKTTIRTCLSARHVPAVIRTCPGVPYTLNGKKVEVVVKRLLAGIPAANKAALADPSVLDFYRSVAAEYEAEAVNKA